ncbi:hypothetical protein OGAPHI_005127 [Ogataea philodendri]|uniref:ABC transporter domain-containing protein n=1 Tax=Ogataea philodendri TaxID=1378263 RepID=A0A9P8T379_9ASCO|nr:uncharacterized protein OGAPHI_005127 [Ogataea philodendri]KAH3663725.1 hypothetical protein OGAPHI_005127 [Ogataea philodendri]
MSHAMATSESYGSAAEPVEYYRPENEGDGIAELHRTITQSSEQQGPQGNVLTRLSTLSRTLSRLTHDQMDKLVIDPNDFDLKRILEYMESRSNEQGIGGRTTDLIFEDLELTGKNTAATIITTAGDVFLGPVLKIADRLSHKPKVDFGNMEKTRKILRNMNGYCEAGTMTLALGRPGSGCSSFLKSLSGETQTYIGLDGEINYNGIPQKEMMKSFKNQVIYNPELDVHYPYLTVEQTMNFAIGCKTPKVRIDNLSRSEYIRTIKDLYLTLYGLKHVEKTLVGNDFVRGISGGQRKRVSIAEAMSTRASVYCFDNATRGLDASTALEFVESLRTMTNITKSTSIVTIYQASENIYQLFDNVTVLYYGRQIYFGPATEGVAYFQKLGFQKGARETSAEFLTSVTDPLARVVAPGFENSAPKTAEEFEARWLSSPEFKALKAKIAEKKASYNPSATFDNFRAVQLREKQSLTRPSSRYVVNYIEQLKLCTVRGFQNIANNTAYTATLLVAAVVQALIVGSLYYNIPQSTVGSFSRGGVIFFAFLYFCIMSLAEIAAFFENKPITNKQRGYSFFHPSADLVASYLTQTPVRAVAILVFSIILYFLSDMKREAGPFFAFILFVNVAVLAVNCLFILVASLSPTLSAANGFVGIIMMSTILYSSYMIQRPSMYWWFKWFSYMNPILYGFEALITLEFRGRKMPCTPSQLIPRGTGYENITPENQICGFTGASASREIYGMTNDVSGEIYLDLAFQYTFSHCWRNFGILIGFVLGFLFINIAIVELYNPLVASSDQLLFIKGAKLPDSLLEATGQAPAKNDEESSGESRSDEKSEVADAQHSTADSTVEKLGSSDIFMWQHVDYVVPYEGEARKLLDDVQGYVLPGTLTALMGESGAGKTTLLNVLSRRTDVGVVSGDMLINGKPIDSSFERRTGYVQQQDLHIAELTVRESLIFAARLRRPHSVPDEEKIAYVDKILSILNMDEYADSIAGEVGYGLNVEQRKKLSIATELVAKPSLLLFLDEPTSGLDSQSSWAIVQVLRSLAAAGQAILCTIHQPSATLFEQFDRLLLLKRGGQTVYFGDIGPSSRIMLDYFESNGGRKCDDSENPAEYILEVIGAGATATVQEDWFEIWKNSPLYAKTTAEVAKLIDDTSKLESSDQSHLQSRYAVPYAVQFRNVLRRTWFQFYRDLDYVMAKFMLMLLAGLLVGFSFWNVKHTNVGMQNVMFACFMALVVSAPLTNQIQERAIKSRELFEIRESKSNTFHWSCLLLSQVLVEIPYSIAFGTVYFICWYFPIQLDNEPSRAGLWWFTQSIFFQIYYVTLGLGVVYASPDLPSANVLIGLVFNFVISFCGVVQSPSLMPGFWHFMWRLSPFTYIVENLVGILLHDREVHCSAQELNYLNPPQGETCGSYLAEYFENYSGYVQNPDATSNCGVCLYRVGDEWLKTVGMSYSHRWRNIGFFCVYIITNTVVFHKRWHLGSTLDTTKGAASPDSTGDQLEWSGRDFLAGSSNTDDDGLSPSLVARFQSVSHHLDISGTVEGLGWVDKVGCSELEGPVFLILVNVNDNDLSSLLLHSTLDHRQTNASSTEHTDVVAWRYLGGVDSSTVSGGDTTAQKTGSVHWSRWVNSNHRDVCHHSVLRERGAAHVVEQWLALASESRSTVWHHTLTLGCSDLSTQIGFSRLAELALFTLWGVKTDDMVANLDAGDTFTNGLDNSGTLVAKNNRELTFRIGSRKSVGIGVANTSVHDFDSHLVGLRRSNLNGLDREILTGSPGNSSFTSDGFSSSRHFFR